MNIFKNIFVVSALLFGASSEAFGMQAPIKFNNSDHFNGGICFANAAMQCLLQQQGFCDFIEKHHESDKNCSMIYNLQHQSNNGLYNAQPSVWPFLQHLETQCAVGKNTMAFVLGIAQQLQQLQKEQKEQSCDFSTHSFIVQDGKGYPSSPSLRNGGIYGQFNKSHLAFSCDDAGDIEIISILPHARCGVMSLNNGNLDDIRNYAKVLHSAQKVATGISTESNNQLKGIVVALETSSGAGHAVSYVNHKGSWWFCDAVENGQDLFFHQVGTTISHVMEHIDSLPSRYKSENLIGEVSFTSPSVNVLFFELDQNASISTSNAQSACQNYVIYDPVYTLPEKTVPCKKEVAPQYKEQPKFVEKHDNVQCLEIKTIDDVDQLSEYLGSAGLRNLKAQLYCNGWVESNGVINERGEQLINEIMQPFMA